MAKMEPIIIRGPSNGAPSQDNQTNGAAGTSGLKVQMVLVAQMELTEIKVRALAYRYIRILEKFLTVSPKQIPKIKPVIWINLFLLC